MQQAEEYKNSMTETENKKQRKTTLSTEQFKALNLTSFLY